MARRSQSQSSFGGSVKLLLALVILTPALGIGVLAYLRSTENRQIRAENELKLSEQAAVEAALNSAPDASLDPFAGLEFSGVPLPSRSGSSGSSGVNAATFATQARLCSDPRWIRAVERTQEAYTLLSKADDLHAEGGLAWRKPANEGRELIRDALESTEAVELELAAGQLTGSLESIRRVRAGWSDKDRQIRKLLHR